MDDRNSVTDSEMEIMRLIWNEPQGILLAPLMEALEQKGKSWKPNTVLTFLSRLADKKMVEVKKQGRLNLYVPLLTERAYKESLTQSFLGKVYGGDAKGLVASLLKQDCLTKQDITELQSFWDESNRKGSEVE